MGISSPLPTIATYKHFEKDILPRIAALVCLVGMPLTIVVQVLFVELPYPSFEERVDWFAVCRSFFPSFILSFFHLFILSIVRSFIRSFISLMLVEYYLMTCLYYLGLRRNSADGNHGARVLCQLWISSHKLLRHLQSVRI